MSFLYKIYQLCIALPILLVCTALTAIITILGSWIGDAHFWGYYPGKIWSIIFCRVLLIPVEVHGREHLDKKTSYVFVANHQGSFDIFLIYGFIGRNFKWMMKKSLRKIFLVGKACESARHIFVDKSGPKKIQETYNKAREILKEGTSLVVFPEGARMVIFSLCHLMKEKPAVRGRISKDPSIVTGTTGNCNSSASWKAPFLKTPMCPVNVRAPTGKV